MHGERDALRIISDGNYDISSIDILENCIIDFIFHYNIYIECFDINL